MDDAQDDEGRTQRTGQHRGNFFMVDRRTWAAVCDLGMNPAVAYLVLARGTGPTNRTTRWSVNAVQQYTGIGLERGKRAITELCGAGCVTQTKPGTRPEYELLSWAEILQARKQHLNHWEQELLAQVQAGVQPRTKGDRKTAVQLCGRGVLKHNGDQYSTDLDEAPQHIWLPNELVSGTSKGERSPVERIRRRQDTFALRLLVDLYSEHNLRDDGGLKRSVLRKEFERLRIGEQGVYEVWAFKPGCLWVVWGEVTSCHRKASTESESQGEDFWHRSGVLQEAGLLSFIPHLCEGASADSEIIHPYGTDWSPEGLGALENQVGCAAHWAGRLMAKPDAFEGARARGYWYVAPVARDYPDVQMVGVARLRYRPHTRRTAAWWGEVCSRLPVHIERYQHLRAKAEQIRKTGTKG